MKTVQKEGDSIDGRENVTIKGNTNLSGLQSGKHDLTIYSNDTVGNMVSSGTNLLQYPRTFPNKISHYIDNSKLLSGANLLV